MLTFTGLKARVGEMTGEGTNAALTLWGQFINEDYKKLFRMGSFEETAELTRLTVSEQKDYLLPNDNARVKEIQLISAETSGTTDATTAGKLVDSTASFGSSLVGKRVANSTDTTFTTITAVDSATTLSLESDIFETDEDYHIADGTTYVGNPVYDEAKWWNITSPQTEYTSDTLEYYKIEGRDLQVFPTPDTDNYFLVIKYIRKIKDLVNADYTTGTVTTTTGSRTVTGAGTTFTAAMVGRHIDLGGYWYKITGYTSGTVITIEVPFQEGSLSGATFTVGDIPLLPEQFSDLLTYRAIAFAYRRREDLNMATEYERLYREGISDLKKWGGSQDTSLTVPLCQKSISLDDNIYRNKSITII